MNGGKKPLQAVTCTERATSYPLIEDNGGSDDSIKGRPRPAKPPVLLQHQCCHCQAAKAQPVLHPKLDLPGSCICPQLPRLPDCCKEKGGSSLCKPGQRSHGQDHLGKGNLLGHFASRYLLPNSGNVCHLNVTWVWLECDLVQRLKRDQL